MFVVDVRNLALIREDRPVNLLRGGQVIFAAYRKLFPDKYGVFEAFKVFSRQLLLDSLRA